MGAKYSVFVAASLDGFIARRDGAIDWLMDKGEVSESEDYGYQQFFDSLDTLVISRKTYECGRLDRDIRLQHVETRIYDSGFVQSEYRVVTQSSS